MEQLKMFEILPKVIDHIPVNRNDEVAEYWLNKCRQVCDEAKQKYEAGMLYKYQMENNKKYVKK